MDQNILLNAYKLFYQFEDISDNVVKIISIYQNTKETFVRRYIQVTV